MSDVRLVGTDPADGSLVPVAVTPAGLLKTQVGTIEEIPNSVTIDGDLTVNGTINGDLPGGSELPDGAQEGQVLGWLNGEPTWMDNNSVSGLFVLSSAGVRINNFNWSQTFVTQWGDNNTTPDKAYDGNISTWCVGAGSKLWTVANEDAIQANWPFPFNGTLHFWFSTSNAMGGGSVAGKYDIKSNGYRTGQITGLTEVDLIVPTGGNQLVFGYPNTNYPTYDSFLWKQLSLNGVVLVDGMDYQELTFESAAEVSQMIAGWYLVSVNNQASGRIYSKEGNKVWVEPVSGDLATESSYFQVSPNAMKTFRELRL